MPNGRRVTVFAGGSLVLRDRVVRADLTIHDSTIVAIDAIDAIDAAGTARAAPRASAAANVANVDRSISPRLTRSLDF